MSQDDSKDTLVHWYIEGPDIYSGVHVTKISGAFDGHQFPAIEGRADRVYASMATTLQQLVDWFWFLDMQERSVPQEVEPETTVPSDPDDSRKTAELRRRR